MGALGKLAKGQRREHDVLVLQHGRVKPVRVLVEVPIKHLNQCLSTGGRSHEGELRRLRERDRGHFVPAPHPI
jgi:hypothetical protein